MNLSDNLKRMRKDNNLSQEQLAEKLNVSRQSVSKWESGIAYPEMDKVLQLCKMFNLNIDELLNQNVKEIDNTKQSKNNINKYIESFFDYITKTINFFSSIKFKEKVKCIIEQIIIICLLSLIVALLGSFLSNVFWKLLSFIPEKAYYITYHIFEALYLIVTVIMSIIIVLHIFKTRYLDYFEYVKEEPQSDCEETNEVNSETMPSKRKELIIIRDPKHSEYKFLTNTMKVILFFIKSFVMFIGLCFAALFVALFIAFALSFMFIKTGLLFVGALFTIVALLIVIFVILTIVYNFITSRKNLFLKLPILFLTALITAGIGLGLILIDTTNFNIIDLKSNKDAIKNEYTLDMNKKLAIYGYDDIKFVESTNSDIKIIYTHNNYYSLNIEKNNNMVYIYQSFDEHKEFNLIRQMIKDVNDSKIVNYYEHSIEIHTSKSNIEIIKTNIKKMSDEENQRIIELDDLYESIDKYSREIERLEEENDEYKETISEKNKKINELNERIEELENSLYE